MALLGHNELITRILKGWYYNHKNKTQWNHVHILWDILSQIYMLQPLIFHASIQSSQCSAYIYLMGYILPWSICSIYCYSYRVFRVISAQLARLQLYWLAVNLAACVSWRLKALPLAPSYIDDCFMVWPLLKRIANWPNCLARSSGYILALFFCAVSIVFLFEYSAHKIWIHTHL